MRLDAREGEARSAPEPRAAPTTRSAASSSAQLLRDAARPLTCSPPLLSDCRPHCFPPQPPNQEFRATNFLCAAGTLGLLWDSGSLLELLMNPLTRSLTVFLAGVRLFAPLAPGAIFHDLLIR